MNIIFFGSSDFGLPSLKALLEAGHNISCVVTQPDRRKGRGLNIAKTAVKELAQGSNLCLYQPAKINTPDSAGFLKKLNPDLFVVIAYGQILSGDILSIPAIMPLNAHASLLPRYRGAAPINRAIINGEKETGVTIIKMAQAMDAGPIIAQKKTSINEEDTSISLEKRLSVMAAELLKECIDSMQKNNYSLTPQEQNQATFAPKLKRNDGLINWDRSASDINNLIRGCLGWPDAFTYYNKKLLKIFKAKVAGSVVRQDGRTPGEIIRASKEGICVATGQGDLIIEELQLEGKRRMKTREFIAGHKILPKDTLG